MTWTSNIIFDFENSSTIILVVRKELVHDAFGRGLSSLMRFNIGQIVKRKYSSAEGLLRVEDLEKIPSSSAPFAR